MSEEGEKSAFNEGALQMQRIDELQRRLNLLNIDPIGFNIHTGQHNFHTIFRTINSLYSEASSKLSNDEIQEGDKIRKIISGLIKYKPIFYFTVCDTMGEQRKIQEINNDNWILLQEMLFAYEITVRHYLEEHDLTSPRQEEEGGWD